MRARPSKKVKDAMTILFEETFYQIMMAMVKARSNESEYAGLHEAARALTKKQMRLISQYAAEFYVDKTNPSPAEVSRKRVEELKKQAIDHALKRLAADEESKKR